MVVDGMMGLERGVTLCWRSCLSGFLLFVFGGGVGNFIHNISTIDFILTMEDLRFVSVFVCGA